MDVEVSATQKSPQELELDRAREAAANGEPEKMVEALYGSFFLDGLVRRFQYRWKTVPREDIEDMVAEAVNDVYVAVRDHQRVTNIPGYLFKAARNKIFDFHRRRERERLAVSNSAGLGEATKRQSDGPQVNDASEDLDPDLNRKRAFAVAKGLIPLLGQQNIQAVMSYVLDAVEAGRDDLTSLEIAEALNLTPDVVRQAKSRGFRKLARIAKERGMDSSAIADIETEE